MRNDSDDIKKEMIFEERWKKESLKKFIVCSSFFCAGLLAAFTLVFFIGVAILIFAIVAAGYIALMGVCVVYEKILNNRIQKIDALIKEDKKYSARKNRFRVINGNGK